MVLGTQRIRDLQIDRLWSRCLLLSPAPTKKAREFKVSATFPSVEHKFIHQNLLRSLCLIDTTTSLSSLETPSHQEEEEDWYERARQEKVVSILLGQNDYTGYKHSGNRFTVKRKIIVNDSLATESHDPNQ